MSRRDPLQRAMAGFDTKFEARLVDEITETISAASMMSDGDRQVLVLQFGEIASALTTILAQHARLIAFNRAIAEGDPRIARTIPQKTHRPSSRRRG